ncbi:hypothetical protein V6N11_073622 [Hibiscus sabdariffa]|uniref:Uncharacterized protein n=1 Tax=Hibiscus sabdariffa TaxID=183260 RepID=A0ABR2NTZ3_9ROSI
MDEQLRKHGSIEPMVEIGRNGEDREIGSGLHVNRKSTVVRWDLVIEENGDYGGWHGLRMAFVKAILG